MNHDVFISYSSKDKAIADALCHFLEQNKIRCWIAPRDITGGQEYGDVIDSAIKQTKLFVLIFSELAAISQWVKSETNIAFSEKKPIIPFKIDHTMLSGSMRVYLNDRHWIDAFPEPEQHFQKLFETIQKFISSPDSITDADAPITPIQSRWPLLLIRRIGMGIGAIWFLGGISGTVLSFVKNDTVISLWAKLYFYSGWFGGLYLLNMDYRHPIKYTASIRTKIINFFKTGKTNLKLIPCAISLFRIICGSMIEFFGIICIIAPLWAIFITQNPQQAIQSAILPGGGLALLKSGWAILEKDYTRFNFTPKKFLKWLVIIFGAWIGLILVIIIAAAILGKQVYN